MTEPCHIISLGAGVQSSTMAFMAAHGEITPMPDCAIFADTQDEPPDVYEWLNFMESKLPFPIYRVSRGKLSELSLKVLRSKKSGNNYTKHGIPAYLRMNGRIAILPRQCTFDFKIEVIRRAAKRLAGGKKVKQWIGISLDEAHRMKPSRVDYIENIWPLIELRMTRNDCLRWMEKHGYPRPPRSACVFCPFHDDREWARLKSQHPDQFQKAVEYEMEFQKIAKQCNGIAGTPYLHRSCVPLSEIDFDLNLRSAANEVDFFGNECEGMCGV